MDEHELESVFRAAQSGDQSARDRLLKDCRHLLLQWARWTGPPRLQLPDAEDRVQDALVVVDSRLARCQWRGLEAFHGWLKKILFRQISDWRRGQTRDRRDVRREKPLAPDDPDNPGASPLSQLPDPLGTPLDEMIRREMEERLTKAMRRLPDQQQQVLRLHYLEGLALDEVAQRLGLSHGHVRNLCWQARKNLRE